MMSKIVEDHGDLSRATEVLVRSYEGSWYLTM